MVTPWKTNAWSVSPWNYAPEVVGNFAFAPKIQIHDLTLRDGEQQAGLVMRKDEKVQIARLLAEVGVDRIEAGTPVVSRDDEAAIREIVKLKLGPKIFALARCMVEDVARAADCGIDGAIVEIPASEEMLRYAYRWPLERAVELSVNATRYAHERGLYTVFFPIDSTRTDIGRYLDLITQVSRDGHMDALAIVDTAGVLSPHAIPSMVQAIRSRVSAPLECHFHGDFGLAVANTLSAVAAGVEVTHLTACGIGERAGNAPLEETVLALLTLYGRNLGIQYDRLTELSHLVREITGISVPSNRAVTGDTLFDIESGIITDWYHNCGDEQVLQLFPFHWGLVGQKPVRVVYGKGSGRASIEMGLEKLGVSATDGQKAEIMLRVKEKSIQKKGLLTDAEFAAIVDATLSAR